jgi:hypothetical protein
VADLEALRTLPGTSDERWQAIADGTAIATAEEIAAFLALSDERDAYERRITAAWHEGFAAGELAHAGDRGAGFAAGVAALKRQIRGEVEDFQVEMRRWHVCCGDCRRALPPQRRCQKRGGCSRCEVRTRETYGLPHPDDYMGDAANAQAAG